MKVLGIYGSPRKGGNSDRLLNEALKGAESVRADVSSIRSRDLKILGCLECGGCDDTGQCVVDDDMQDVYPRLLEADVIIVASPMFFYGVTSWVKALIDRCQALWNKRMMEKTPEQRKSYEGGRGYLIAVGATKGKNLFDGAELGLRYFFDALDMTYEGGVFVRSVEGKNDIAERRDAMEEAFEMGRRAAEPSKP
ncbi:MAG: flavodoxin family protein [Deltaproteobacteria bacterium]